MFQYRPHRSCLDIFGINPSKKFKRGQIWLDNFKFELNCSQQEPSLIERLSIFLRIALSCRVVVNLSLIV